MPLVLSIQQIWPSYQVVRAMSIMRCDHCDRHVDTDYDVEGEFTDHGFICFLCLDAEGLLDDEGNFNPTVHLMGHAPVKVAV